MPFPTQRVTDREPVELRPGFNCFTASTKPICPKRRVPMNVTLDHAEHGAEAVIPRVVGCGICYCKVEVAASKHGVIRYRGVHLPRARSLRDAPRMHETDVCSRLSIGGILEISCFQHEQRAGDAVVGPGV